MPAISPSDPTLLPRVLAPEGVTRPVAALVEAPTMLEGEGFKSRRAFAGNDLRLADPFLLLDHMGAVEYAPGEADAEDDRVHAEDKECDHQDP
jgi:quercetin 2,3-dioxygenase